MHIIRTKNQGTFLIIFLVTDEEYRYSSRACMASDSGAYIVDHHFAFKLRESCFYKACNILCIFSACRLGYEALATIVFAAQCPFFHDINYSL